MSSIVKVDTIQENTSANGITVDGLNIKDSKLVTANSVVASNITADAIDATKIADNAISEEHLDVTSITGHTAETSIADGDTILIHDASASALRKMTKANFVSGIGGSNNLMFYVTNNGTQNISNNTLTKVTLDVEVIDTDNKFASSRYTPGEAGTYFIHGAVHSASANNGDEGSAWIYKNGAIANNITAFDIMGGAGSDNNLADIGTTVSQIIVLDDNDYIELYARQVGNGQAKILGTGGGSIRTSLFGYKLIT